MNTFFTVQGCSPATSRMVGIRRGVGRIAHRRQHDLVDRRVTSGWSPRGLAASVTITSGRHWRIRRTTSSSSISTEWPPLSRSHALTRSCDPKRQACLSQRELPGMVGAAAAHGRHRGPPRSVFDRRVGGRREFHVPPIEESRRSSDTLRCRTPRQTAPSGMRLGSLYRPSSATRVPPPRRRRHDLPPSRVARIVPNAPDRPTALCIDETSCARSGTLWSVRSSSQVCPPSPECSTQEPGRPPPRCARPAPPVRGNQTAVATPAGSAPGGACQVSPAVGRAQDQTAIAQPANHAVHR